MSIVWNENDIIEAERQRAELVSILQTKGIQIDNNATLAVAIQKANEMGEWYLEDFIKGLKTEIRMLNTDIQTLGNLPFIQSRTSLNKLYIPNITSITNFSNQSYAMSGLTHLYAPELTYTGGDYSLGYMSSITNLILPKYTSCNQNNYGFITGDNSLTRLIAPKFKSTSSNFVIGGNNNLTIFDIKGCRIGSTLSSLKTLILRDDSTVPTLASASNIPSIEEIYVPQSLVNTYKTATNWSTYSDKIFALEESDYEDEDWYENTQWYEEEMAVWQ